MPAENGRESPTRALESALGRLRGFVRSGRRDGTASNSRGCVSVSGPDDVPFCPLFARGRIGPDWARRTGVAAERVEGEVESFDEFAGDEFDPEAVHPEVRRFYERTAEYALTYETTWHPGFRLGARLASLATSRLEQLNLPGRSGVGPRRLESRLARVAPAADPRGSRVWTRTDPGTGEAVFVAIYATCERDGVTYATAAVPLPGANLSTVLRPVPIGGTDAEAATGERDRDEASDGAGADGGGRDAGVAFTTRPADEGRVGRAAAEAVDASHEGLYLVTPIDSIALPMDQTFRVYPADDPAAPPSPVPDATLVATHEMRVAGRRFLTIRYGVER